MESEGKSEAKSRSEEHEPEITTYTVRWTYAPLPVRRVEIPKDNGKKRQLGIPTVEKFLFFRAAVEDFKSHIREMQLQLMKKSK